MDEIIHHLAVFVSRLWQIHIFGEGNTRTTAVFFIKYLKTLGFSATNDIFAKHAWYFRNALVRANYTNLQKDIHETTKYLELFLRNLVLGEKNELHNRYLHISGYWAPEKVDIGEEKVDFQTLKVDIKLDCRIRGKHFPARQRNTFLRCLINLVMKMFLGEVQLSGSLDFRIPVFPNCSPNCCRRE